MNVRRVKVLGLLGLPLLAIAVAVMIFAIGNSSGTAEAADLTIGQSVSQDFGVMPVTDTDCVVSCTSIQPDSADVTIGINWRRR